MRAFFYVFAFCYAGFFLFMLVNWFETNRLLANLLMSLLVGVAAAAVLQELKPEALGRLMSSGDRIYRSMSPQTTKLEPARPIDLKSNIRDASGATGAGAFGGTP